MAQRIPKIVLYREKVDDKEVDGGAFAAASIKAADVVDAFGAMQTDFVPVENTVLVNHQGCFLAANLTESDAKELAKRPEVLDVVDDIDVYAVGETPAPPDEPPELAGDDVGTLELDPEDSEALKADPYPELEAGEEQMSPAQLALLCQLEPSIDFDIELEEQLGCPGDDTCAQRLPLPKIPKAALLKFLKCVAKCLLEREGSAQTLSDEELAAVLREAGLEDGAVPLDSILQAAPGVRAARDVILPNLLQIYAPWAWRFSLAAGVRVAVVDTGIAPHPDLRIAGGVSYVPGVRSWRDDNGHGTHVAGTIAAILNRRGIVGVGPAARVYAVKVLNRGGSGKLSWILNGLMWCYRTGMHVVNLSLGSGVKTHDPRVYNRAFEHVGGLLRRRGILPVAAAGNGYHKPVGNPARCPSYLAVSAIDYRRRLTTFTNVGPQVEICAPGLNILSTIPGGRYSRKSGTSMACPHVAAVAALVKQRHRGWHGDRIRVHLWRTALDLGSPGRDWAFGYGQVNAFAAVR